MVSTRPVSLGIARISWSLYQDMAQSGDRRRKHRRNSHIKRETSQWFSLIVIAFGKIYPWIVLAAILSVVLGVGFFIPAFTNLTQ